MTEAEALTMIVESMNKLVDRVNSVNFTLSIINLCLWCFLLFKNCRGGR